MRLCSSHHWNLKTFGLGCFCHSAHFGTIRGTLHYTQSMVQVHFTERKWELETALVSDSLDNAQRNAVILIKFQLFPSCIYHKIHLQIVRLP